MAAIEVPDYLLDEEEEEQEEAEADALSDAGRDAGGGEPDAELAARLAALRGRFTNLYYELLADQPGASPEVLRRQLVRSSLAGGGRSSRRAKRACTAAGRLRHGRC